MAKRKGLVILHIDGLGYHYLVKALDQGRMPFVKRLIDEEGYEAVRYRCGLPSTTPFCQAGILYGDNSEIPSFRWWDKQSGVFVTFGGLSTFRHVAHKYFNGCVPITRGGASIATCFPDSSQAAYKIGYREHGKRLKKPPFTIRHVLRNWALNPLNLVDWFRRGLWQVLKANIQYWPTRLRGLPTAPAYVIGDMLNEILLHQFTRFAVVTAMQSNYPVIYGAFYAYDETAHAFGPDADYSFRILRHIDNTIRRIAAWRSSSSPDGCDYELVLLSDHGQVETVPYDRTFGNRISDLIAEWLPTFEIEEVKGKKITRREAIDGHIALTYSGGLAHWYFKDISHRMSYDEIEERFPGLVSKIASVPGIGFALLRENSHNLIIAQDRHMRFESTSSLSRPLRQFLEQFDEPDIVARQLAKLNSFERSGDLILFGAFLDGRQVNFEDQVGGHGSIGGEQLFPFLLGRREWQLGNSEVISSSDVYPLLKRMVDRFAR